MKNRILLSIVVTAILFIFTSCDLYTLFGNNGTSNLTHDNFLLKVENPKIAVQGEYVTVDISLYDFREEKEKIGGFDLLIAYDPQVLQLDAVTAGKFLTNCEWWYYAYRNYIDTIDSKIIGTIRIVSISDHYFADPLCFSPTDSSTNQVSELTFLVTNDRQYEGTTTPVQFYWKDCGDNMMADYPGNQLYASNNIYTSFNNKIQDQSFPTFLGYNNSCDSLYNDGKLIPLRIIDFVNSGIRITSE